MTLIYHVYPKDQWCDPREGMHPFVSKVDYDALAAELAVRNAYVTRLEAMVPKDSGGCSGMETPVNPTMQHAPDCPILHGKECLCDPFPIDQETIT